MQRMTNRAREGDIVLVEGRLARRLPPTGVGENFHAVRFAGQRTDLAVYEHDIFEVSGTELYEVDRVPLTVDGLARNLRYLRRKAHLSQKQVSAQLGLRSSNTVSHWESGKHQPRVVQLMQLVALYNTDPNGLLFKDKEDA